MFANLTKLRTYVKPMTTGEGATKWLVVTHTPVEAFMDDLHRYGLRVAAYNLIRETRS